MTDFSLRQVRLRPGEEHREVVEVELAPLMFGGQRYLPVPERVSAELVVAQALTGTVLALAFDTRLHGPVRAREYQATSPDDDELRSPYLDDDLLDVSAWARDAIVLALPDKILCRPDCAGLCAVCGGNLNDEPHEHETDAVDPRWAALRALTEDG